MPRDDSKANQILEVKLVDLSGAAMQNEMGQQPLQQQKNFLMELFNRDADLHAYALRALELERSALLKKLQQAFLATDCRNEALCELWVIRGVLDEGYD